MSEKQFIIENDKLYCDDGVFVADLNLKIGQNVLINLLNNYEIENNQLTQKIKDNQEGILLRLEDVVNKLNEQQDTIGEQKIAIDELITDYKKLEKENEQLQKDVENLQDC